MTMSLEDIAWHRSVGQMIDALDQTNFWTQLVRLLEHYVPFDSWVVLLFSSEHKPLVFAECPGQDGSPDQLFQDYLNGLY
ncbi:helix-turn-helix transcriptional regulator, partial [Pseudomonas helleri]|nr:helix-turn-helix transcriptional regulator [Pseudomonas helleri]